MTRHISRLLVIWTSTANYR